MNYFTVYDYLPPSYIQGIILKDLLGTGIPVNSLICIRLNESPSIFNISYTTVDNYKRLANLHPDFSCNTYQGDNWYLCNENESVYHMKIDINISVNVKIITSSEDI